MRVMVTGGTGFLGRQLCAALLARGDAVTVVSRDPGLVRQVCGPRVEAVTWDALWAGAANDPDALINLAGAAVFDRRWSVARKDVLQSSRIGLTQRLVRWMVSRAAPPATLLSGSAIGVYGDRGDALLDEASAAGCGFLEELCSAWEAATEAAAETGVRVCRLRTGVVLHASGGMLQRMLPLFRVGLGCRLGDGHQWMSWIHLADWIGITLWLLDDPQAMGAFNLTTPQPVTQEAFTLALGRVLHRPVWARMPTSLLRVTLGERAGMVLGSQRVLPASIQARGYRFHYPALSAALQEVCAGEHQA